MINKVKKQILQDVEELKSVTCDVCKKEYDREDYMEVQEFSHIKLHCGYGSIFGDGDVVRLDICQHCLKEKLGTYLRIEEEE